MVAFNKEERIQFGEKKRLSFIHHQIDRYSIQLLESPIPAATPQKAPSGDILGTQRDIIDPLDQRFYYITLGSLGIGGSKTLMN